MDLITLQALIILQIAGNKRLCLGLCTIGMYAGLMDHHKITCGGIAG